MLRIVGCEAHKKDSNFRDGFVRCHQSSTRLRGIRTTTYYPERVAFIEFGTTTVANDLVAIAALALIIATSDIIALATIDIVVVAAAIVVVAPLLLLFLLQMMFFLVMFVTASSRHCDCINQRITSDSKEQVINVQEPSSPTCRIF